MEGEKVGGVEIVSQGKWVNSVEVFVEGIKEVCD